MRGPKIPKEISKWVGLGKLLRGLIIHIRKNDNDQVYATVQETRDSRYHGDPIEGSPENPSEHPDTIMILEGVRGSLIWPSWSDIEKM